MHPYVYMKLTLYVTIVSNKLEVQCTLLFTSRQYNILNYATLYSLYSHKYIIRLISTLQHHLAAQRLVNNLK